MRSETFGRLLKGAISSIAHYEGKTAPVIEEELGTKTLTSAASIQRYKAGHIPPGPQSIAILAEAAVKRGYLGCIHNTCKNGIRVKKWLKASLLTRLLPLYRRPGHTRSPGRPTSAPSPLGSPVRCQSDRVRLHNR